MGSSCRSCAKRQGAQPCAGVGCGVPEGPRSDAPGHTRPLYSTLEGAHRAGSGLRTITRRCVVGRSHQIKASQEWSCRSEGEIRLKSTKHTSSMQIVRKRYHSRTVETLTYTYFHVLSRARSTCKLLKMLDSWTFDTVEVCGSSPHGPAILFNHLH